MGRFIVEPHFRLQEWVAQKAIFAIRGWTMSFAN